MTALLAGSLCVIMCYCHRFVAEERVDDQHEMYRFQVCTYVWQVCGPHSELSTAIIIRQQCIRESGHFPWRIAYSKCQKVCHWVQRLVQQGDHNQLCTCQLP